MRLVRFNDDRLGVVIGNGVADVSAILDRMDPSRWPVPPGDALIAALPDLRGHIEALAATAPHRPLSDVTLLSPVANPSKIIGAPVNYAKHLDEARADAEINRGAPIKTIDDLGLFLKSTTSLIGPSAGVHVPIEAPWAGRRVDHEVELAVVIGKPGYRITRDVAFDHVCGYTIGLDMTVRGTEDRSYRKSLDTFTVLGPALVTADGVPDPGALDLSISVNGQVRQASNTRHLIFDIPRLIEYASAAYCLYPGDIILTGTPEGVGPVAPGDVMTAEIEAIGSMEIAVH